MQNTIWSMKSDLFETPTFSKPRGRAYAQFEYASAYNFRL